MKLSSKKSANKIIKQMLKLFYEYVDRDDRLKMKNKSQRKVRAQSKKQIFNFSKNKSPTIVPKQESLF